MGKTQHNNIPKLRFPEFEGEWDIITIGSFGKVSMCKRIMKLQTEGESGVPFYKIGTFGKHPDAYISRQLFDEYKSKYPYPKKGEILISAAGTIGRTVVFDGKDSYYQDSNIVWVAHDETKIRNTYLEQFYHTVRWTTEDTTIARLYNENLRSIKVPQPSLPEQEKIAGFLGAVDDRIAGLVRKKDLLERYKKGAMQAIFSQKIRFTTDTGTPFPDWQEKKLGEVVNISNGTTANQIEGCSGVPVTRIETISDGTIDMTKVGYIHQEDCDPKYILNYGDILFSHINSVAHIGKIAQVRKKELLVHGMNLLRLQPNAEGLNSIFLYYCLTLPSSKKWFERVCNKAVNQASINQTELAKTILKFPHPDEQSKIADFLSAIDDKITLATRELTAARAFKRGLLQQMFV